MDENSNFVVEVRGALNQISVYKRLKLDLPE